MRAMPCRSSAALAAACWWALGVPAGAGTIEIVGPADVLAACWQDPSGPILKDDAGRDWALVVDPRDPEVAEPDGGRFWPAPTLWVEEAVAGLEGLLDEIDGRILILPFPRRGMLRSSCDGQTIYLSPRTRPFDRETVHFLVFHEIGHLVHRQLLPDWDGPGWQRYRIARGIQDEARFHRGAAHTNRPHEIFAEDFRKLFGTPEARAIDPLHPSEAPALGERPAVRTLFCTLLH